MKDKYASSYYFYVCLNGTFLRVILPVQEGYLLPLKFCDLQYFQIFKSTPKLFM